MLYVIECYCLRLCNQFLWLLLLLMLEGNYTSRLVVSHVDEISTAAKPQPLKHFQLLYPAARHLTVLSEA